MYIRLKEALPDVQTSVGELKNDSRNVIELIENAYNVSGMRLNSLIMAPARKGGGETLS